MAEKSGTKRKIPIEKISTKNYLATCHTKRLHGLFSKSSELCLLSGSQIAILATPPSSTSNVSFHSFGHSSVDSVVSAFLAGNSPPPLTEAKTREDSFWWDNEALVKSDDTEELTEAVDSISRLLHNLKELRQTKINEEELMTKKKSDVVPLDQQKTQEQAEEHDHNLEISATTRKIEQDMDINEVIDFDKKVFSGDFYEKIESDYRELKKKKKSKSKSDVVSLDKQEPLDQILNPQPKSAVGSSHIEEQEEDIMDLDNLFSDELFKDIDSVISQVDKYWNS